MAFSWGAAEASRGADRTRLGFEKLPGSEVPGSEPAHLRRRRKRSRATGEARGLASKQIHSWFCMVLANLLLFANFVTIKYLLYCGSRRNRLAGTEPIPVRFRNTGWRTLRSSFALGSIENVVIVTESCEMTVCQRAPRREKTKMPCSDRL